MRLLKKKSTIILLAIIILFVIGGIYMIGGKNSVQPPTSQELTPSPIQPTTTSEDVFCTQDAMQCPDGSFVGRIPPDCEFAACPGN